MTVSHDKPVTLEWPLMQNNVLPGDMDEVIRFLSARPVLTQSREVSEFEREWSEWLGVRYGVFVNSGSSANLLTLSALRILHGPGQIVVPPLTWVSDIAAVLHCGFEPVFADIRPDTLGMSDEQVLARLTPKTKAVFLTHILGYNALTEKLADGLRDRGVPLIEDCCESHGATFKGKKIGTFGLASNFSFYYAHHLTTIEGGMVSTDDEEFYETVRMLRSHGLVREARSRAVRDAYIQRHPDLNPEFIFAFPAYNVRSTEINAVLGRHHLKRLDGEIKKRNENLKCFLDHLDGAKYRTDFATEGCSNYALTLVLRKPDPVFRDKVMEALRGRGIEFRRGASGGGNQLRQPYLKKVVGESEHEKYPEVEHVHFYGFYIGNYPDLARAKILALCDLLNRID